MDDKLPSNCPPLKIRQGRKNLGVKGAKRSSRRATGGAVLGGMLLVGRNTSLVGLVGFLSLGRLGTPLALLVEVEVILGPVIEAALRAAFVDRPTVLGLSEGVDADYVCGEVRSICDWGT